MEKALRAFLMAMGTAASCVLGVIFIFEVPGQMISKGVIAGVFALALIIYLLLEFMQKTPPARSE